MSGKFALVIGNTEHIDPGLAKLTAPGKDTDDFARILRDANICAFDKVDVLLDQPSSAVIEAIDEFFDQKQPGDLLLLYFSGHGVRDESGSLYLAVKNTIRSRLRSTAVKSDYIRDAMEESRSKRQVVILDCCNSGAFPQGTKAEVGGTMGLARAFQGYGRFVITASDATQFAWEGDRVIGETQNSLFTHFLIKGLEGEADDDGDGRITVDELYDYAYNQIAEVMPNQTPTKSTSRQEGDIVLRDDMRLEDIKPVPLPDELLDEIDDTRPYVREAAVQKLDKILKGKNKGMARSAMDALEKIASDENSTRRIAQTAAQIRAAYDQKIQEKPKPESKEHAPEPAPVEKEEYGSTKAAVVTPSKAAIAHAQPPRKTSAWTWGIFGVMGCCLLAFAAWSTNSIMKGLNSPEPTPTQFTVPSATLISSTLVPVQSSTPRPVPTLTSQPTSAPTAQPVLLPAFNTFQEGFDDNSNGWSESDIDGDFFIGGTRLEDGIYILESTETKKPFVARRSWTSQEVLKDFNVSVNARLLEGDASDICYGLAFRENDKGYYAFFVCDDNSYKVRHFNTQSSEWTDLQDWTKSEAIKPGEWNTLSITVIGDTFTFYINNEKVATLSDETETEGKVYLVLDVLDAIPGAVGYDDLAIQEIFYDSFANNDNSWSVAENDDDFFVGGTRLEDGIYILESTETKKPFIARRGWNSQEVVKDFNVSVDARLLDGDAPDVCYGLAFRENENGYYAFLACDDKSYSVRHYNAQTTEWTDLRDWKTSEAIRPGDWNTLGITAIGDTFTFYINNEKVTALTDETETEGKVRMVLYMLQTVPGAIGFDDFTLVVAN